MQETSASRSVTTRELLDIRDEQWRVKLSRVSLAAEVLDEIDADQREQALQCLGRVLGRARSGDHVRQLRNWPAVQVVATTGVAADHYTSGTFWPFLHEALSGFGLHMPHGRQEFQSLWGDAFLRNLDRLGLQTFEDAEDAGSKYVGRILMHCGMPNLCLFQYFAIVTEQRSKHPGLTPDELVSWVSDRAERGQMHNTYKPVTRFLHHGGDYAVDVTARVFDLLDAVVGGSDGADAGLPVRFRTVAGEMHAQGELRRIPRGPVQGASRENEEQPQLLLEPFGLGVTLRLPGVVGDVPGRTPEWVVDADGDRQRVAMRARLEGFDDASPSAVIPVTRPVRSLTATLAGRGHAPTTVPVVDDAAPLLAFDENGELRAPGKPLPGRPTWLLFPGGPDALRVNGASHVLTESPVPPGWTGWCLLLVDLEGAASVGVAVAGGVAQRPVRQHASARVALDDPVPGARTAQGRPVHDRLPELTVPADLRDAAWDVVLLDDSDAVVARWQSAPDDRDPQALWDSVPRPLVGSYSVRIRGPWGRGTRRSFDVVEGLSAHYTPGWRRFATGGLQVGAARFGAGNGVELSRMDAEFGPADRETVIRAGARGPWLSLVVTPPHMTVAYQTEKAALAPSIRPIPLFQEDVRADAGNLVLDIGESADPKLYYLAPGGAVQTIEPRAGRHGVWSFDLVRLTDTLAEHPRGRLALDPDGALVVADIRPRKLFGEILMLGRALELTDAVDTAGLTALVYATRAPWLPPSSIPIVGGRAELPDHLRDAGPMEVSVRIEDPWVPQEVPEWPAAGESRLVDAPGHVVADNPGLTGLSAFLAGDRSLDDDTPEFRALWTARGMLHRLGLGDRREAIAERLDEVLRAHPREALLAVSDSRASMDLVPSVLIRSGLAWADIAEAHDDVPPLWTARNALAASLLSAADGDWSPDEIDAARGVTGDAITELLAGRDPAPKAGRLDQAAKLFDAQPDAREALVRAMGLVPKGLLSEDSRVLAVMEYVRDRRHHRLEWFNKNARNVFAECLGVLAYLEDPVADAAVAARRPTDTDGGWRVVPAISLAFALAARHAAHGRPYAASWLADRQTTAWSRIAEVAPAMVTTDLILAELLVAGTLSTEGTTP